MRFIHESTTYLLVNWLAANILWRIKLNAIANVNKIAFWGLNADCHCAIATQKELSQCAPVLRSYVFPEDVAIAKIITVRRFALISAHTEASSKSAEMISLTDSQSEWTLIVVISGLAVITWMGVEGGIDGGRYEGCSSLNEWERHHGVAWVKQQSLVVTPATGLLINWNTYL